MDHNPNPTHQDKGGWHYSDPSYMSQQQPEQQSGTYYVEPPEKFVSPQPSYETIDFHQQQGYQYPQQQRGYWQDGPPQYHQEAAQYPPGGGVPVSNTEDRAGKDERRLCGLKKPIFLALVAAIATALVVAVIVVGVVVGISMNNRNHGSQPQAPAASGTSTAASGTTGAPTQTTDSPSATPTATEVLCPAANDTTYSTNDGDKIFLLLCGIDYSGQAEATDVKHVRTASMTDCMDQCAAMDECEGAGWGVMDGDQGNLHDCWMKKDLGKSHKAATSTWNFAVLQDDDEE
jgi:hypothetical protein